MHNYDSRQLFGTANVKIGQRIKKEPFWKKRLVRYVINPVDKEPDYTSCFYVQTCLVTNQDF